MQRSIDLDACPLGYLFDCRREDHVERAHLPGWHDAYNSAMFPRVGPWRVVDDADGGRGLEYPWKADAMLLAGDTDWRDYTVEAGVRQFINVSLPTHDDESQRVARSGLILRCADVRRFYWLCLEGLRRVVLYCRADAVYSELATHDVPVDITHYYTLKASCRDDQFTCSLDDKVIFTAQDATYDAGRAGIRTNCVSRFRGIAARYDAERQTAFGILRDKASRELAQLREANPKPVLHRTIPLPSESTCLVWFGCLRAPGKVDMVIQPRENANHLVWERTLGVDAEGHTLWEYRAETTSLYGTKLHCHGGACVSDINGDGLDEVLIAADGEIVALRGCDGTVLCRAPLPTSGVYGGDPGKPVKYASIYPVKWRPAPAAKGFALIEEYPSDGGNCLFALDAQFNELWRRYLLPVNYGHTIDMWDIDGDGRDEVFAGYHCLNADGDVVWQMEGYEQIHMQHGARHPDTVIAGDFAGDASLSVAYSGGGDGFYLVDAITGKVKAHDLPGHSQWMYAGNLRPDLPGMELATSTLHGNVGIVAVYDCHGKPLHRFQASNAETYTPLVNWSGSGEQLFVCSGTFESFGLYDARGRRVVDRWINESQYDRLYGGPVVKLNVRPFDLLGEGRDQLLLFERGNLLVYKQDSGEPIQRIHRRSSVWPLVNYPA